MRKLLLGTTAVVGAALIGATTASAQTAPTARIGGYFDFSAGSVNDNADRNITGTATPTTAGTLTLSRYDFRVDTEIHVIVQGKAANGLTYGAVVEFEMDAVGVGSAGTAFNTDEMFATISGPGFGTVRLGDTDSAAGLMQVRPARYAGFQGLRVNWVRAGGNRYAFGPINDGADNTKVVYMSPQFSGFDFGLSFALNGGEGEREVRGVGVNPDTGAVTAGGLQRARIDRENELTGALRYRGTFGGVGIAASFAFSQASAPFNIITASPLGTGALINRTQNPTAYSVGLTTTFAGLNIGGEYTWGRYSGSSPGNTGPAAGNSDGNHWLIGAGYTIADVRLTANFGRAVFSSAPNAASQTSRIIGAGAAYTLAPGWSLYGYYETQRDQNVAAIGGLAGGATRNTNGFVIGTSLTF